ncbi:MAG: AAA family ATPase [Dehalococcoidia bacterium]|nr:AAA family ATPase [Dehalococcoidia bacterium]
MIVFLNGPFGVGKSTTARILATLLPDAVHYNPEHIGVGLRMALGPFYRAEDYQDLAAWRRLVPVGARLCRLRHRNVVMPMTVWRRDYLDELVAGLRRVDRDLRLFQLTASADEIRGRVLGRPDARGSHDWWWDHLESGLAMANDPAFGDLVDTAGLSPLRVASTVAARVRG